MLKFKILIIILFLSLVFTQDCPPADTISISSIQNNWTIPVLNNWNDLDIMTWNVKEFPLSSLTVNNISEIISDVLPDIILFQEINDLQEYSNLATTLYAYDFINSGDEMYGLAMAFRKDSIELLSYTTLFPSYGYEFAWRYPLKAEVIWNCGDTFLSFQIINLHFKCCNDGFERRLASSQILSSYVNEELSLNANQNIILGGDFNDDITDSENNNSLLPILENDNIYFTTSSIASNSYYDSYPSYNSFLDHIAVTNNILESSMNSDVNTIRLDDYMGWSYYQNNISDHRPVTWSMTVNYQEIPTGLIINEIMNNPGAVSDSYGEWLEIYNNGNHIINLIGYILEDSGEDQHIISENLFINPDEYLVLGIEDDVVLNGNIDIDYVYNDFFMSNFWDEIILKHPYGIIMNQVFYDYNENFPNFSGSSMMLLNPELDNNNGNNWNSSLQQMENGDYGTPGESNYIECEINLDLNQDGYINIIDVILLVNHIIEESIIENSCIADFDSDGNINIIDIVYIVSYILNTN